MKTWREFGWPALIAAIGIVALWTWALPRAIDAAHPRIGLRTFDYYNYFLPRFEFGSVEMAAGRLPIWNDFEYGGIPFLATAQPAALYPPKILAFAWLDPATAMQVFLIAHYALLAGGFLLFARQLGIGGLGALVGCVYWTFATTILVSNYHPNRIACIVWIPLVFWLADRVAKAWRGPPTAAFAMVVALQLVAGYPAFTLSLVPLLFVHSVASHISGHWDQPPWQTLPRVATAFALGACIAGLQIVPLAEIAEISQRAANVAQNAPAFLESIQLLINERGPTGWNFVLMAFPGLTGFWVAALARKDSIPAAAGAVTCVLFGVGGWIAIRVIPGFSMIRHGLVWLFLMQFYLAWLAALGARAFERLVSTAPRTNAWVRGSVALAGLLWAAFCVANLGPEADWIDRGGAVPDAPLTSKLYGGDDANVLGAVGGVLLAASAALRFRRRPVAFVAVATLMLGQIAAFPFGGPAAGFDYPLSPRRVRALAERASVVPGGRSISDVDRTHGTMLSERVPMMLGMEITFVQPRSDALQQAFVSRIDQTPRWSAILRANGLLDAMNVDLLVAPTRLSRRFVERGLLPVGPSVGPRTLFRNPDRLGEAWVNTGVREFDSERATLEYVLSPDFDPHHEVVVEAPLANRYPSRALQPPTPAEVRRTSPTRIDVSFDAARNGVLVLSDAWYPGWQATLDGEPVDILRVDHVLRGVEVPAGAHRVRFEYRPASIRWGLAATSIGTAGALALFALPMAGKRQGR